MRIFVFGNINSGKSHLGKLLSKRYDQYNELKIDEFRVRYGDGTKEGDILAQNKFIDAVLSSTNAIIECTGYGPLGKKLSAQILNRNDIILFVSTPARICIDRIKDKDFSRIPYPKFEESLEQTINRCDREFENGAIQDLWKEKVIRIHTLTYGIDLNQQLDLIPWNHYFAMSTILRALHTYSSIESIFTYGSFARNELSLYSDIDMYVVTKDSPSSVLNSLKKEISEIWFSDLIDNKITLRFLRSNTLAEITVIDELRKGEKFIRESLCIEKSNSIFKINERDLKFVDSLSTNESVEHKKMIDTHVRNIIYFLLSLHTLIKKNDSYKYYFHFNIILHHIVQIKAILNNQTKFDYLPLHAIKYIEDSNDHLWFNPIKDNMVIHIHILNQEVINTLSSIDHQIGSEYMIIYKNVLFAEDLQKLI